MSKRPLSAIRVGNFKAFGETQTIPIKPITLIFGPNSAGKSSIIHSLAFAHEVQVAQGSAETRDLNVHGTDIGGSSIDLGGFNQFVHGRDTSKQVDLSWEFEVDTSDEDQWSFYNGIEKIQVSVQVGLVNGKPVANPDLSDDPVFSAMEEGRLPTDAEKRSQEIHRAKLAQQERERRSRIPVVTSLEVLADGEELIRLSHREVDEHGIVWMNINRFATGHKVFSRLLSRSSPDSQIAMTEEEFKAAVDASLSRVLVLSKGLCGFTISFPRSNKGVDKMLHRFWKDISTWFGAVDGEIGHALRTTQYLGPLRALPPRHFSPGSHKDIDWMAGGGYAWDLVTQDETVRAHVNGWLGTLTQKPYKLSVKEMVALEEILANMREELVSEFYEPDGKRGEEDVELLETTDIDEQGIPPDWELDEARGRAWDFVEHIQNSTTAREPQLALHDGRTEVSHRDVGVGISQVLPVLVAAFGSKGKTIAMEQPELHLHPALQAELADVFIQCSQGEWGNTFILETHSEHLILRIMRRIREGTLSSGDVSVIYVEPARKGQQSEVKSLRLDEEGDFIDEWPSGFFEESYKERFAGR